jgi:Ca-activated chloride channel family protein
MIEALSAFHFQRPLWLLALVPAILLFWLEHRAADVVGRWRRVIDAELLKHLLIDGGKRSRITPNLLLLLAWTLAAVAVAGPAWQREPSPFADARPPVVVVLKVTPSMTTEDLAPTRLDRARQKLSDLLARREGASTGLIAYSGSSHLVLPPTPDSQVVLDLAKALEPGIMPMEGDDLATAVVLARRVLSGGGHGGSILVLADTVAGEQLSRLGEAGTGESTILAMVPPNLDATALDDAARALGATIIATTADQTDVTAVAHRLDNVGRISGIAGEGQHWQEAGYWLTPLFALLALIWFRRGWVLT